MPVIEKSSYKPLFFFRNGHVQTMFPRLWPGVAPSDYTRRRIETPDGDFLDLDEMADGADKAVVILHGLEGNSRRPYIVGMAGAFKKAGWDVFALNYRGCGGEPNRLPVLYHQGSTGDLHTVLEFIQAEYRHEELALVGFSLGGNLLLKYLGDGVFPVSEKIGKAAAVSVPCELRSCAEKLAAPSNRLYMRYFLRSLEKKVKEKKRMYPDLIDDDGFDDIRTFMEFDDRYTAPLHGFSGAMDYYRKCGCGRFLPGIKKPALLINALDDPFLSEKCFPFEIAEKSSCLFLETPRWGGHAGFVSFDKDGMYWHERRVIEFICENKNRGGRLDEWKKTPNR